DAARLARQARSPEWAASPAGRAWAATYEARALLAAGDRDGMLRAVDDAQAAYGDIHAAGEPPWLYSQCGPTQLLDHLDTRLMAEGPAVAEEVGQALGRLPGDHVRDHAWYRARLALAWARAGDESRAAGDAAMAA